MMHGQSSQQYWMKKAYEEALCAYKKDMVPVGCVLTNHTDTVIMCHNRRFVHHPKTHSEITACYTALDYTRCLKNWTMYVTLEPCLMCAHTLLHSGLSRLYFGAYGQHPTHVFFQESYGGWNHHACATLLRKFFSSKRVSSKRCINVSGTEVVI